jgi:chorismate--pyruvate lyase
MSAPAASATASTCPAAADAAWVSLASCVKLAPPAFVPWLAEPGLLTARVRAAAGAATQFRMLRLESAPLLPALQARLAVDDEAGLVREIEFACAGVRWIFAQSVFPASTVDRYPWLRDLGESPLGEALRRVGDVVREPLEYAELAADHPLARLAHPAGGSALWARRAVYRLAGAPIIVQEVFLPALGQLAPEAS